MVEVPCLTFIFRQFTQLPVKHRDKTACTLLLELHENGNICDLKGRQFKLY